MVNSAMRACKLNGNARQARKHTCRTILQELRHPLARAARSCYDMKLSHGGVAREK
jgi:hypothetical protein